MSDRKPCPWPFCNLAIPSSWRFCRDRYCQSERLAARLTGCILDGEWHELYPETVALASATRDRSEIAAADRAMNERYDREIFGAAAAGVAEPGDEAER